MYEQSANQPQAIDGANGSTGQRRRLLPLVPNPSYENRRIGRGWMWHTMFGGMLAVAVTLGIGGMFSGQFAQPLYSAGIEIQPNLLEAAIVMGMVAGSIVGIAQAFYLRPYLPNTALLWWIAATGLAGVVSGLLFLPWTRPALFTPFSFLDVAPWANFIFVGAGIGAILGIAQWLVLNPHLHSACVWVLACAGAGVAAATSIMLTFVFIITFGYIFLAVVFPYCSYFPLYIVMGALIFLPPGAITGAVLAKLLRMNELLP